MNESNETKPTVIVEAKSGIPDRLTLVIVQGIFGILLALIAAWTNMLVYKVGEIKTDAKDTREATVAIQHSVNSERDRIVAELKATRDLVTGLEGTIKLLLVERAATTPSGKAPITELQSSDPLPPKP